MQTNRVPHRPFHLVAPIPRVQKPIHIDCLPYDVVFNIVSEVLELRRVNIAVLERSRAGPADILEGGAPWEHDRRYLAKTVVQINRTFREVARRMLWTKVLVTDTRMLERLGVAASQYPLLASWTARLDLRMPYSLIGLVSLNRLVENMANLRTIVCESKCYLKDRSHSDVVVNSLNRFCSKITNAIFRGDYGNAPTASSIVSFLEKQPNLEILHVDDIKPSIPNIHPTSQRLSIPRIPPTLKAKALRVLSIGDGSGGGWFGYNGVVSDFWAAVHPEALPALESVVFHEFSPKFLRFVSRHSKAIRRLSITSSNKYFYATPRISKSLHILQTAVNVTHLTIWLDIPPFFPSNSVLEWQPLPSYHPCLEAIVIRPKAATEHIVASSELLEPLLRRILSAIVAANFPRLSLVTVTDKLVWRVDVATSDEFKGLVLEVRNKKGGVVVKALDTGLPRKLWWMNETYDYEGVL